MKNNQTQNGFWQLKTFGTPQLFNGAEPVKLSRKKSLAILILLAIRKRPSARETLASWFWPDLSEQDARTGLRTSLSDLNRVLGKTWLKQDGDTLVLSADFPLEVDVDLLSEAVSSTALSSISRLEAWSDDFLEGFHLDECDVFEEWCYAQREASRNALYRYLGRILALAMEAQNWSQTMELATSWLELDPLCEAAHMAIMRVHDQFGRTSQALLQYKKLQEKLELELGVSPNMEAQLLASNIKEGKGVEGASSSSHDWRKQLPMGDIGYAKSGAINIAYRQFGEGNPTLVFIPGFVSHIEQFLEEPFLKQFFGELAKRFKVIIFDKRGMGLSDRSDGPPSPKETANDVVALLDHVGVEQAWAIGVSEGGPAVIQSAHDYPDRIIAIVLLGTAAKWVASPDYPHSVEIDRYDKWLDFLEKSWGTAINLEHFAPSCFENEEMVKWWKKTLRMACSPGAIRTVLDKARDFDVRDCLADIKQPALVSHQDGDRLIRVANGRYLAEHLPNSDYLELPGNDHWVWVTDTARFFQKLDEFILRSTN